MADPEGVYAVDISMTKAPLGIEGVTVTADRLEKIVRGVRLEIGLDPRSLRARPILRAEIEEHVMRNHNVEDLIRWRSPPAIVVHKTRDGPCFEYRGRQCIAVYLNGFPLNSELVDMVPLDGVETVVVLMPNETVLYPSGAILLYTAGFIR